MVCVPGTCVHCSKNPTARLAAEALDQNFRLAPDWASVIPITLVLSGSCGLWADLSHCPKPNSFTGCCGMGLTLGKHVLTSPRVTLGFLPWGNQPSQTPDGQVQSVYKILLRFCELESWLQLWRPHCLSKNVVFFWFLVLYQKSVRKIRTFIPVSLTSTFLFFSSGLKSTDFCLHAWSSSLWDHEIFTRLLSMAACLLQWIILSTSQLKEKCWKFTKFMLKRKHFECLSSWLTTMTFFQLCFMFLQKCEQIYLSMKRKLMSKSFSLFISVIGLNLPQGVTWLKSSLFSDGLNPSWYCCTVRWVEAKGNSLREVGIHFRGTHIIAVSLKTFMSGKFPAHLLQQLEAF